MKKTALVLGSTGLVGAQLLKVLAASGGYQRITAPVRRLPGEKASSDGAVRFVETDFDRLDAVSVEFAVDHVFCCLGTTIKKAGSEEAFRRVDYEYPHAAAKLAEQGKAAAFLVVTAMGSNKSSWVFYNKVKGQLEDALKQIGIPAIHIFRPSLLIGERAERRSGEELGAAAMKLFGFAFQGPLLKYKAIESTKVAAAMAQAAASGRTGFIVHESDEMQRVVTE